MSTRERIIHSLLFEAIALVLLALFALFFTQHDPLAMSGLAIAMSFIAMGWNYVYNLGFDHFYGSDRMGRGIGLRVGHGVGFELGLLVVSLPLIMWVLQLDFWQALLLDAGMVVFFLIYAIVFNWLYDITRHKLVTAEPC